MTRTVTLIVLDSLRFDIYREFMSEQQESFLATLRGESVEFENATTTAPWSLPSHASMFTGKYPLEHGAVSADSRISESCSTLLDTVEERVVRGCFTANPFVTPEYGFDGWDEHRNYCNKLFPNAVAPHSEKGGINKITQATIEALRSDKPVKSLANGLYAKSSLAGKLFDDGGRQLTRDACSWIETRGSEDVFLFMNYMETHDRHKYLCGLQSRIRNLLESKQQKECQRKFTHGVYTGEYSIENLDDQYVRELLQDELRYVDRCLKQLWQSLVKCGRGDDCLFIVCSDHGDGFGEGGFVYHSTGITEPIAKVPLLIRHPSVNSTVIENRVSLSWVYSTILQYLNGELPPEGSDLLKRETYSSLVGMRDTNRLEEQLGSSVKEQYLRERLAVYESDRPSLKHVREDQTDTTYAINGLNERDTGHAHPDLINDFEAELNKAKRASTEISSETKKALTDLGYL